jgi:MYXO-CTERM domain-containing protein
MLFRAIPFRRRTVLLSACALLAATAWAVPSPAGQVSGSAIASIALANVGDQACSSNSLGGTGYYTSCTGYAGEPEYWCADFARWVWNAVGVDASSLNAAASSFETYGNDNNTWHDSPELGDAVVFTDPSSGEVEHVAIVVQVNSDGTIETVSGDWNGTGSTEPGFASTSTAVLNAPAYASTVGSEPSVMGLVIAGYASPVGLVEDAGAPTGPCGDLPCWGQRHRHAVVDVNGDGKADLCGRGAAGVFCWLSSGGGFPAEIDGPTLSNANSWNEPQYDTTIQFADVDGDGKSDVCARAAAGFMCWLSEGTGFGASAISTSEFSDASGWDKVQYYATIQMADVNGDGKADVCGRGADGFFCLLSTGSGFGAKVSLADLTDSGGWDQPQYYATIQMADVNGDGKADVCGRGATGFECWLSTGTAFGARLSTASMSDSTGWNSPEYYTTIQMADVNGDGNADVCGRGASAFLCVLSTGTAFSSSISAQAFTNASGWSASEYYGTIQMADVNGDGKADVCGRAAAGFQCLLSTGSGFGAQISTSQYSNASGWSAPKYYTTLQTGDVDGDGKADVCGRGGAEVICELSNGAGFPTSVSGPSLSDSEGWDGTEYYETLALVGGLGHGPAGQADAGRADGGHPEPGGDASTARDGGADAEASVDSGAPIIVIRDAGRGQDARAPSQGDGGGGDAASAASSGSGGSTAASASGCTCQAATPGGARAGWALLAPLALIAARRRRRPSV